MTLKKTTDVRLSSAAIIANPTLIPTNNGEIITGDIDDFPVFYSEREVENVMSCSNFLASKVVNAESSQMDTFLSNCTKDEVVHHHNVSPNTLKRKRKIKGKKGGSSVHPKSFQDQDDLLRLHTNVKLKSSKSQYHRSGKKDCAACGKSFQFNSRLKGHILDVHCKASFFCCAICGDEISTQGKSVDRHMSDHASRIECPTCCFQASNIQAVDNHIGSQGEGHLRCRLCGIAFRCRIEFFSHVNDHIPRCDVSEPIICKHCDLRFLSTCDFNAHIENSKCIKDITVDKVPEVSCPAHCIVDGTGMVETAVSESAVPVSSSVSAYQVVSTREGSLVSTTANGGSSSITSIPQEVLAPGSVSAPVFGENIVSHLPQDQVLVGSASECGPNTIQQYQCSVEPLLPETDEIIQPTQNAVIDHHGTADTITTGNSLPVSMHNGNNLGLAKREFPTDNAVCTDVPPLMCSLCGKTLQSTEIFEKHVKNHTSNNHTKINSIPAKKTAMCTFVCQDCGQSFVADDHLEQHTVTFHSNIEGIVCPVCKSHLSDNDASLNEHLIRVHELCVDQ